MSSSRKPPMRDKMETWVQLLRSPRVQVPSEFGRGCGRLRSSITPSPRHASKWPQLGRTFFVCSLKASPASRGSRRAGGHLSKVDGVRTLDSARKVPERVASSADVTGRAPSKEIPGFAAHSRARASRNVHAPMRLLWGRAARPFCGPRL